MRIFKGRTSVVLRAIGLRWQTGCFDHRLRDGEDPLPVFAYVYRNPIRAGLADSDRPWPAYYCSPEDWIWFGGLVDEISLLPDWLA